jgi:hypothetical protein
VDAFGTLRVSEFFLTLPDAKFRNSSGKSPVTFATIPPLSVTLNLYFHALWMLSAIGAAVCAAEAQRPRDLALSAVVFIAACWWFGPLRPPDPTAIGAVVALAAAHRLVWPSKTAAFAALGGLLAGVNAVLMRVEGLPAVAAIGLAATLAAASAILAWRRPRFAPAAMREEAAIALLLVALIVAVAPGVGTGWSAAQTLNLADRGAGGPPIPSWVIGIGAGSLLLGGMHRLWSRR